MTRPLRPADPTIVPVALPGRAYDVVIGRGVMASLGALMVRVRPGAKAAIVTDENVARLHLAAAVDALGGASANAITIEAGESAKSFAGYERVCEALVAMKIERGDVVVALGGGVVGDLAGFAAATVRRGIGLIQVPTTLLAQVDSSVGGKTGINAGGGKNLVGAFYQPILVVADTALIDTLPPREFRAGYAEVVKYAVMGDAGFFAWLDLNRTDVFAGGAAREQAIAASVRMKAAIVVGDEREAGDRALLNFGHTFGHALEAATGFSPRLIHGEAVAIGMVMAAEFSARLGVLGPDRVAGIARHLAAAGLPVGVADIPGELPDADALMAFMAQDKKVNRGSLTLILLHDIGRGYIAGDVDPARLRAFLVEKLEAR